MDSNALVNGQLGSGLRLVAALGDAGVDIVAAFWAKLTEAPGWSLYLASPVVDTKAGSLGAYGSLLRTLVRRPELEIDSDDVLFIDVDDSMAVEAAEVVKSKVINGKPYTGITRFKGDTLGGLEIDGAYIYPPPRAPVTA